MHEEWDLECLQSIPPNLTNRNSNEVSWQLVRGRRGSDKIVLPLHVIKPPGNCNWPVVEVILDIPGTDSIVPIPN